MSPAPRTAHDSDRLVEQLDAWRALINVELAGIWSAPMASPALAGLAEAIEYSLLGAGKRIRPILVLATADAWGVASQEAVSVAAAFEMIHAYSLVHDDLPCMDDDDMRRGQPTSHRVYGEGVATLVGDALQAEAFARIAAAHRLSADARIEIIRCLAEAVGWLGMVGGQFLDVSARHATDDLEALRDIHARKTGALIAAAVEAGGVLAGASPSERFACREFGTSLGWLFQLVDDILDVTGDGSLMGRPSGSDQRSDKVTALDVFGGVDAARQAADTELERCLVLADSLPAGGGALNGIARFIHSRDH